jgi:hypothetical protein
MTATVPTPPRPDPSQDPTHPQRADQAFNQLNPTYELAVDQSVPGWHHAVQEWEAFRSLGGRVDNHLRIDNTGPVWSRHMVVVWRAHDALQRGAREQAEQTFARLNPDFGVLADSTDPAQHGFAQQRERGLALGVRATVAAMDEHHPHPQQRQAAITARARTAARQGRGDRLQQARRDRPPSPATQRRAERPQRASSGERRPRAQRAREEDRGR